MDLGHFSWALCLAPNVIILSHRFNMITDRRCVSVSISFLKYIGLKLPSADRALVHRARFYLKGIELCGGWSQLYQARPVRPPCDQRDMIKCTAPSCSISLAMGGITGIFMSNLYKPILMVALIMHILYTTYIFIERHTIEYAHSPFTLVALPS